MIDEELYQQAADELNSDKRRPHIWARACALASDDHDEARFLYTNLRVEELIAERENAPRDAGPSIEDGAQTLALAPLVDPDDDSNDDPLAAFSLDDSPDDIPSSVSSPSGKSAPLDNDGNLSADDLLQLDPGGLELEHDVPASPPPVEPDPHLMADYVPEPELKFDETYNDEGIGEDEFAMELESFKAEENDAQSLLDIDSDVDVDALDETHVDLDSTARLELSEDEIADLVAVRGNESDIQTAEFTESDAADMTQANMDVLDAQTNELDEMLEDAKYQPPEESAAPDDMQWLENEPDEFDEASAAHDQTQAPVIYEENPYRDELNRQADELGLDDNDNRSADYSQQIADKLSRDETFPEPLQHLDTTDDALAGTGTRVDASVDEASADDEKSAVDAIPVAAAVAASAGTAAVVAKAAAVNTVASTPDITAPIQASPRDDSVEIDDESEFPLDLTRGREGTQFSIYRRDNKAQAVKNGVSWSALFLTLPYLIYRQLFGTALAYIVVWLVAVGGLVVSGLAWLDAAAIDPAAVSPLIQACTIGFALLAFIALVYLPFRHANAWRTEKLENRGFELVAVTKARNPGRAIARARRHAALG